MDPRKVVADGYDDAAEDYERWLTTNVVDAARDRYLDAFCVGPGWRTRTGTWLWRWRPNYRRLSQQFDLTGIDISARQIALARKRLPNATFRQADMTAAQFEDASFEGIAAFYSLIHLPYGELPAVLARIARWLAPGGTFVASLAARASGEHYETNWLGGAPMYWSGHSLDETMQFLDDAALVVAEANMEANVEDGEAAPFLWVVATRPAQTVSPLLR